MLEAQRQAALGPQDQQPLLLYGGRSPERQLKPAQDVRQHHTLLVEGKLLTNAVPEEESGNFYKY